MSLTYYYERRGIRACRTRFEERERKWRLVKKASLVFNVIE